MPPGGGQPPYGNAPVPGAPQGGSDTPKVLSFVSMGTGIVGLLLCCCWGFPVFSIAALVTGFVARKQTEETGRTDLKTFILTGLITGAIGIVVSILYWIISIATGGFDFYSDFS